MTRAPDQVVVIGASAGGVEALTKLVPFLPPDSPAAYVVVVHVGQGGSTALPNVLRAKAALPVGYAEDGEPIEAGRLYVAPPGVHTVLTRRSIRLLSGPRENGHRPAVDTTFRSAAAAWDGSVTGVILSGSLDDGAAGIAAIAARGGTTYVQDPDEALYPAMPLSALGRAEIERVLPIEGLGRVLAEQAVPSRSSRDRLREVTMDDANRTTERTIHGEDEDEAGADAAERLGEIGTNTDLTCPGCGGAIWEIEADGVTMLRCHVGHSYGLDSFEHEQSLAVESALWTAVRALEEKQILLTRLGESAREEGRDRTAKIFLGRADDVQRQADGLRALAESVMAADSGPPAAGRDVPA